MSEGLKVIGLEIKDFLAIKHLKVGGDSGIPIPPDLALFIGENGEGKTDIIKGFEAGLLGIKDTSMIRNGADKTEIIIDLAKYRIERTLTRGGTHRVKTSTEDKSVSTTLQTFVDNLIGMGDKTKRGFLFNPIDLVLSKDKAKYLRDLFRTTVTPEMLNFVPETFKAGLDYSKDGMEILAFLSNPKNGIVHVKRKELNEQADQKEALLNDALSKMGDFDPANHDLTRVNVLREKLTSIDKAIAAAQVKIDDQKRTQEKIDRHKKNVEAWQAELSEIPPDIEQTLAVYEQSIADIEKQIHALQKTLEETKRAALAIVTKIDRKNMLTKDITVAEQSIADLTVTDVPDIEALKQESTSLAAQHEEAKVLQAKHDVWSQVETTLRPQYMKIKTEADNLTDILKRLRTELPDQLAKEANMPFDGLRFDGDKVFISAKALNEIRQRLGDRTEADGEISLDNMATHEQMLFGLIGSRKMNAGPYMVICMDRLESLDKKSMAVLREWAKKEDQQILGTYVIHEGERLPDGALLVQDGKVKKAEQGRLA